MAPAHTAGCQRARCHRLVADIANLADECDVDLIVDHADTEQMPTIMARLEAARAALEAIYGA